MKLRAEVVPGGGLLSRPVSNAQNAWRERRGLILRLIDECGTVAQGEASPLPGYSADDLATARTELEVFARRPLVLDPEQPLDALLSEACRCLGPEHAAARFAVETALLDWVGQRRQKPLWFLLRALSPQPAPPPAQLPVSALVTMASEDEALRSSEAALERGVTTLKLKVGRDPELELRIAAHLRAAFGPRVRLRLDANRAFSPRDAAARLEQLSQVDPEFLEEPLDVAELVGLGRSPVPLALDESLLDPKLLEQRGAELEPLGVVAIVLKPMLLGGFSRCLELAARAKSLGLRVVVSHLFDGPIGLAAAAALGLAAADAECASGLGLHPALECWPEASLPMVSGAAVLRLDAPGLGLAPLAGNPA